VLGYRLLSMQLNLLSKYLQIALEMLEEEIRFSLSFPKLLIVIQ